MLRCLPMLVVACVLVISGLSKVLEIFGDIPRDDRLAVGLPMILQSLPVTFSIGLLEALLGFGLLLAHLCRLAGLCRLCAAGTLTLFACFAGFWSAVFLTGAKIADCGCFGSMAVVPSGPSHLLILLGLVILTLLTLSTSARGVAKYASSKH